MLQFLRNQLETKHSKANLLNQIKNVLNGKRHDPRETRRSLHRVRFPGRRLPVSENRAIDAAQSRNDQITGDLLVNFPRIGL